MVKTLIFVTFLHGTILMDKGQKAFGHQGASSAPNVFYKETLNFDGEQLFISLFFCIGLLWPKATMLFIMVILTHNFTSQGA